MLDGARLEVVGGYLKAEEFEVREEVTYNGEGEMLVTEGCIATVQ
jgi:hypothetical protein